MNEKLKIEIENIDWNNLEEVINFYENNILYFRNYSLSTDIESIIEITEIKISYIFALNRKNHYTKAYTVLREVDILIQKIRGSDSYDRINERYLFAFGINAHKLKNYEESQEYFHQLLKLDPDNDLYKEWNQSNKDFLFAKKANIIGYIGLVLFVSMVFSDLIIDLDFKLRLKLELTFFLIMALGFYATSMKRILRKYKFIYK